MISSHDIVRVELGSRAYDVVVGAPLVEAVGELAAARARSRRAAIVTNQVVRPLWGEAVVRSMQAAGFETTVVCLEDGERHKSMRSVETIHDHLLDWGVDRSTLVVAVGGGVVGDLAGFAAATLLRGVPVVHVPTTLLAQVDSSVGGKTAVNHPAGKNLIGAFHQPALVVADVATLGTLPRRELLAGLAEVIKYGVIGDADLFATIETRLDDILAGDRELLTELVARSVRQKAAVVVTDEREERGERAVLNFGHTVGHGIEAVTSYERYLHGEAVAMGMVAAARISEAIGVGERGIADRLATLLSRAGLPSEMPAELRTPALVAAIQRDKKATDGRVRFVAIEAVGRTRFVDLTSSVIVRHL